MERTNPILEFITEYDNKLQQANISNGKQEILWYLEAQNLINRRLYFYDIMLTKSIKEAIQDYYNERITQKPFQYILNSANFYGRDFYVDKRVLIPRPETETIIKTVRKLNLFFNTCLEIGVGSGCVAITLCLEKLVHHIIGTDISLECLKVAKINQRTYNVNNLTLEKHDILTNSFNQRFDLIVSNPPYITYSEYNTLPLHIKNFEPKIALTDNKDGLIFYKQFAQLLPDLLSSTGIFVCEISTRNLIPQIKKLFTKQGYKVQLHYDLNQDPRVVSITSE